MSPKAFCHNNFKPYSDAKTLYFKDGKVNLLTNEFIERIRKFEAEKLNYLTTDLREAIFYDSTVYTGSAGLALYFYTKSLNSVISQDKQENLSKASEYLDLNNLKSKRLTFLCGDAGPLALAAVISHATKENKDLEHLIRRLTSLSSLLKQSPDELLYGKSGYLYALLFVNKHVGSDVIPQNHIREVVNLIIDSGKQFAVQSQADTPLLWEWHDKIYLGAAHGVAGILYMLLQARAFISERDLQEYIKPTLDWLMALRFTSGNFPSSLNSGSGDRLVQWCHGAPGFVPLCILASEVFIADSEKYMKIALDCGDVVWERGLSSKGFSICHGVSGNAYTFLQLYQATKNPLHYYRACCFMDWCMDERPSKELHYPDRPASLFEGLVGRLYLAQDIFTPDQAKFPAMCL